MSMSITDVCSMLPGETKLRLQAGTRAAEIRRMPYLGSMQERLQVASGKAVYGMVWIGCVAP